MNSEDLRSIGVADEVRMLMCSKEVKRFPWNFAQTSKHKTIQIFMVIDSIDSVK